MAKIVVQNMCACAKKRKSWSEVIECADIKEASKKATDMCEQGNTKFCKRHRFELSTNGETITIRVLPKMALT